MKAEIAGEMPKLLLLLHRRPMRAEFARIDLDHQKNGEVVEDRRDRRHQDHVKVGDLEEFGDQEGGGPEDRRRKDRAESAGGKQTARRVLGVPRLGEHRIGDRAQGHRRGDPRTRRSAEQKRRQHHGASRAAVFSSHRGEGKVDVELAGARKLEERAVDRKQDDQRGRDIHGDTENAFERHIHVAGEPRDVIAAVCPRLRQIRTDHRVDDEQNDDERHDPARGPARRFQDQHDERHAENLVPQQRIRRAIVEIVSPVDDVGDDYHAEDGGGNVPPHDPVAKTGEHREEQERQEQDKAHMDRAHHLRRHDPVSRIEVKERHDHGDGRQSRRKPAAELVGFPLFLFDEFNGLFHGLFADDNLRGCRLVILCHGSPLCNNPLPGPLLSGGGPGGGQRSAVKR